MYTECPECQTYFKITPEQLKAAEGKVRCGNCNHVFNALTNLAEKVPPVSAPDAKTDAPIDESSVVDVSEPTAVEIDDGPESVIAFQVSDPESEAALSEFSLPSTADSLSLADSKAVSEKEELSLESVSGLSALDDAAESKTQASEVAKESTSVPEISEADLSVLASQIDESPEISDVSSVNTELSGFSELNSMPADLDVEAPNADEVKNPSGMQSKLSAFDSDGEVDDVAEMGSSESLSFADVDIPGVESTEEVAENNLDDINKDIDNALDNLFDDDELQMEKPVSTADPLSTETPISEVNNLSGIDSLDNDIPSKVESSISELDLSDVSTDAPASKPKQKPVAKEPEFDLEDSFLMTEPLKSEATDWEPNDGSMNRAEAYAGDNFKLEELEESKSMSGGGASRALWIVLIMVLLFVLVGQFAYLKREELAKYPSLRPVLEQTCAVLSSVMSCEVPEPRDVSAIVIVERNVVSHPNAKNALLITSTINNEAEFDQKFPELVLTFSDINQEVLARRTFKPEEYLAKGVDIHGGMKSKVPVKIMLEIVDPGEAAVNFKFDFR